MRKYIITALVTAALTFSFNTYGAEISKIGKKIEGEYSVQVIKVANPDGETLSTKSISVDGTTYVPLRVAADTFGYNAEFENKTVILTERRGAVDATTGSPPQVEVNENALKLSELNSKLNQIRVELTTIQMKQVNGPLSEEDTKKYKELEAEGKAIMEQIEALKNQM